MASLGKASMAKSRIPVRYLSRKLPPDRTRINVVISYADPPGGRVGEVVADAISNPEREIREDLEHFAKKVERGELKLSGG